MTEPKLRPPGSVERYREHKGSMGSTLLLMRLGDFYEAFDEDARTLSRVLRLTLTTRSMGEVAPVPLAGIPYHSLSRALTVLNDAGYRVEVYEPKGGER